MSLSSISLITAIIAVSIVSVHSLKVVTYNLGMTGSDLLQKSWKEPNVVVRYLQPSNADVYVLTEAGVAGSHGGPRYIRAIARGIAPTYAFVFKPGPRVNGYIQSGLAIIYNPASITMRQGAIEWPNEYINPQMEREEFPIRYIYMHAKDANTEEIINVLGVHLLKGDEEDRSDYRWKQINEIIHLCRDNAKWIIAGDINENNEAKVNAILRYTEGAIQRNINSAAAGNSNSAAGGNSNSAATATTNVVPFFVHHNNPDYIIASPEYVTGKVSEHHIFEAIPSAPEEETNTHIAISAAFKPLTKIKATWGTAAEFVPEAASQRAIPIQTAQQQTEAHPVPPIQGTAQQQTVAQQPVAPTEETGQQTATNPAAPIQTTGQQIQTQSVAQREARAHQPWSNYYDSNFDYYGRLNYNYNDQNIVKQQQQLSMKKFNFVLLIMIGIIIFSCLTCLCISIVGWIFCYFTAFTIHPKASPNDPKYHGQIDLEDPSN